MVVFNRTIPVDPGTRPLPVRPLILNMIIRGRDPNLRTSPLLLGQPGTPPKGVVEATTYLLPDRHGRQCKVLTGLSETTTLVAFKVTRLEVTGVLDK